MAQTTQKDIDRQILDIQNLKYKINDIKLIKVYESESKTLRMLLDKLTDNAKNYTSYVNLSKNDLEKIKYGYIMLDQIDLDIKNLGRKKSDDKEKVIPFSFRSFKIFLIIIILLFIYYYLFLI